MLVHPARRSPIVAAGPAPRKSLEKDRGSLHLESIFADEEPSPRPAAAEFVAGKTGEWCERNSVALLEACCNRDIVKGAWMHAFGARRRKREREREWGTYFRGFRVNSGLVCVGLNFSGLVYVPRLNG